MKTAIDTIREALESAHHQFQNILDYGVAEGSDRDKVRAEQDILKSALASLKSLEGRLTVDEAMEAVEKDVLMPIDLFFNSDGGHRTHKEVICTFHELLIAQVRTALTKSANP